MKKTGGQNPLGMPGPPGRAHRVRLSGRRDPAGLRRDDAVPHPPHPRAPRAGRHAHGRRLRARQRRGRRRHRDLRPRRDQHGHRHRHGHARLVAHRLHHRPGRQQADRLRRLSGDRHHRRHAADHEAQLPGHARRATSRRRSARRSTSRAPAAPARCSSTSPRTRSSRRAEFDWDGAAPTHARLPARLPARSADFAQGRRAHQATPSGRSSSPGHGIMHVRRDGPGARSSPSARTRRSR